VSEGSESGGEELCLTGEDEGQIGGLRLLKNVFRRSTW
jgi:hypothetical protein